MSLTCNGEAPSIRKDGDLRQKRPHHQWTSAALGRLRKFYPTMPPGKVAGRVCPAQSQFYPLHGEPDQDPQTPVSPLGSDRRGIHAGYFLAVSFSRIRFDHYARELSLAIYDLSLESRESPFLTLKQDLRNVVEYGRPNSKPHLEPGFQRYSFVGETFEPEEVELTPISRLKDKLIQARGVAQRVATDIEAEADSLIAEEAAIKKKTALAFAPHKEILGEARGELAAIEDALNLLSNGGPALDPLHEPEPIAPVSTTEPQA